MALIVGGEGRNQVELFSGNSQLNCGKLASLPTGQVRNPVLAFLSGKIVSCDSDTCWNLNVEENKWKSISEIPNQEQIGFSVGQVYKNKLYLVQGKQFLVFDQETGNWTSLRGPSEDPDEGGCAVTWKDTFLLFGGRSNPRSVQKFDHVTQKWGKLDASAPIDIVYSGCTVLDEQSVLITGSENFLFRKSSAVFEILSNTWKLTDITAHDRFGTSLISINGRVFAAGGGNPEKPEVIEEFHPEKSSWTETGLRLSTSRRLHSAVKVPFNLFAHLCY